MKTLIVSLTTLYLLVLRRFAPLGLVFICATEIAHAQQIRQFTTPGFGANSCAKFGKDHQASPDLAGLNYFAWVKGFMSGINADFVNSQLKYINLAVWDVEKQERLIRQYCSAHPLDDFQKAAVQLLLALQKENASK